MTRALLIATAALLFGFAMTASCGDKPKAPGCKGDKDCKSGQVCGDNKCVECNDDSQCKKGMRCSAHACIAGPQCTKDDQCPSGEVPPPASVQVPGASTLRAWLPVRPSTELTMVTPPGPAEPPKTWPPDV